MSSKLISYLKFYWKATTVYHLQAPMASDIAQVVLNDHRWYYIFDEIKTLSGKMDHPKGRKLFRLLQYFKPNSITIHPENSEFQVYLPKIKFHNSSFENFVFVDSEMDFTEIKKIIGNNGVMILNNPYNKFDLQNQLKEDKEIQLTLNFHYFLIGVRHSNLLEKQHFDVIDFWKKPWKIGLFV